MKEFSYIQKTHIAIYKKKRIDLKIVRNITLQKKKDSRFIIFKKVLSDTTILESLLLLPRNLYKLEDHRWFAQDDNKALQDFLREQFVFGNIEGQQNMTLPQFYLSIAKKKGIVDAKLAPDDKLILHEASLKVFCNNYSNSEFNLTLIYYRLFKGFIKMLPHQMSSFSTILKLKRELVKVFPFFLGCPRKTICGLHP